MSKVRFEYVLEGEVDDDQYEILDREFKQVMRDALTAFRIIRKAGDERAYVKSQYPRKEGEEFFKKMVQVEQRNWVASVIKLAVDSLP